ncbi:MAG TPA: transferrin receptor-like dimerization domain-containing protein [Caulobacteraceae bacterium]|jgi:N-acetylated-alpha-linked acidic dipeptidase
MITARKLSLLASAAALALAVAAPAFAAPKAAAPKPARPAAMDQAAAEHAFDAQLDPAEMAAWMKQMASEPNHVGSPHDKANAEFMLAMFKSWGWDAHIEEFQVLYPVPISETLEMVGPGDHFAATLTEGPIAGDPVTTQVSAELPAYVAYQGDGDVTAPLVYANYGMPDDYKALERLGVSVKGKIVITRYGAGWRGLKPKLAQEHGAVGCIIYSDPHDDGYYRDDPYPKGGERPPNGFQRGSVQDMTMYPGDPLTPGIGATKDAKRLTRETAKTILKIPTLPISYGDAQHFLAELDGPVAPADFRGALPITYHVGGGDHSAVIHLAVKSDWSLKTIYDTVAMIKGSEFPDQWVLRGNHHDGWVFGAADPLSGNVSEMEEAKAIGGLVKQGWRPKRTLVYLGWDGEEPGLLGSTEWAETHQDELRKHGVLYVNTDGNSRGFLGVEGSPSWTHAVNAVASDVTDPESGALVEARLRARAEVDGAQKGANEDAKLEAKAAADGKDMPLGPLGSGSDYSSFFDFIGIAAMNVGYGGEAQTGGSYHSAYDTYEHYRRFDDPEFHYAKTLAETVGRIVLRAADDPVPPVRFTDAADAFQRYDDELHKLAKDEREHAEKDDALLGKGAYKLAEDPLRPMGPPARESAVPDIKFAPLDAAIARLKTSAAAYDAAIMAKGASLSPAAVARLDTVLQSADGVLLNPDGLPGRPWYRNMIYAPGVLTGYGSKTLPGVREAIEGRRWEEADKYAAITAQAIEAYAAKIDEATAVVNGGK